MRVEHVVICKYDELSDEAKEKARNWYCGNIDDSFTFGEIMDSLKELFKRAHLKLKDYSIGTNSYCYVQFDLGEEASKFTGKRALAWLENNLFAELRITPAQFKKNQKAYMGYGEAYRVGKIKPCPLTGLCVDDDLLGALTNNIKAGMTLRESFADLADVASKLAEDAAEYERKQETVEETIRANDYEFTVDGKIA